MLKKKICLIGAFGVGKTSLVARFVRGIFSEKYLTTIGVKIDSKQVDVDGEEIQMMVWDMAGEDEFQRLRVSYLKGAAGCIFVADGTREESLRQSREHMERTRELFPEMPGMILLINKVDLKDGWEVSESSMAEWPEHIEVLHTSAKTGENVEEAFEKLARLMIVGSDGSEPFL